MPKERVKAAWIKALRFITNPRLLLCVALAWIITNGWSYVLFAIGSYCKIEWMSAVGGAYLAFLWLPISPEKLATCAIAMLLLRWWFPRDEKTLAVLKNAHAHVKSAWQNRRETRRKKSK